MSAKDELFSPGWWKYLLFGVVCGLVFHLLCGCSSAPVSEPKYPEYDKWWTSDAPKRGQNPSGLVRGYILAFDDGREAVLP